MTTASAGNVFLITPNNDNDLPVTARAISFAVEGDLHILDDQGDEVTIPSGALVAGSQHVLRVRKVFATGTTATGIVGYS